jgi:hypothetical protein
VTDYDVIFEEHPVDQVLPKELFISLVVKPNSLRCISLRRHDRLIVISRRRDFLRLPGQIVVIEGRSSAQQYFIQHGMIQKLVCL